MRLITKEIFKEISSNALITFVVTLVCFLMTYEFLGFYYVEYESLSDSFYSGSLTESAPFRSMYYLGSIGLSFLYSLFYQLCPNTEWISWFFYAYLFVAGYVLLYITDNLLPERFTLAQRVLVQAAVYFLIVADHNIHFIYTRVSYMVSGSALVALVYFFKDRPVRVRWKLFLALNIWFVIGALTRIESTTTVLLLIVCFAFYYLQSIKQVIIVLGFPILFTVCLLILIAYDFKTATDYYMQVEPEIEAQFCERDNIVPLGEMKTARDSAIWKAARTIMWSDPKVLTPQFMRSLIRDEGVMYASIKQWKRVWGDLSQIITRFWYLSLMSLIMAVVLVAGSLHKGTRFVLAAFLFAVSFWVLMAVQNYTVKINDRSFAPLISLYLMCYLLALLPLLKLKLSKKGMFSLSLIMVLFSVHVYALKAESNVLEEDLLSYKQNLAVINKYASNKLLVLNSTSCDYIFSANRPLHPFDYSTYKKIYIVDGFNIPFLPYYRSYLEKECKCNMEDFPSFWNYLRTKHDEVMVLSQEERVNVLKEYLHVVHGYDLPLEKDTTIQLKPVERSDSRGIYFQFNFYRLKN